jgi:Ni,Fe-hydrogenase III large subunit/Ni,Fe-hydrogenase III component G
MNSDPLSMKLTEKFSDNIYSCTCVHSKEQYMEVNPLMILDICTFIDREQGCRLVTMFAADERVLSGFFAVYYTFADRQNGQLIILKTNHSAENPAFISICPTVHAAALYEREIQDMFGLVPLEHPDPRRLVFHSNWPEGHFPLRKDFDGRFRPDRAKVETPFKKVIGEGVFEVPVGPVHAGIIEPGHFRFSVAGDPIINLEAQLYFVHKGIEKMCEGESLEKCLYISERISGDETFTNSLAYCQAVEKLAGVEVPVRARYMRVVFAELERLTSHLGDLAGICLDVAYGFAAFQFRMLKGWSYLAADELCGMRFLRSVNSLGGVRKDFVAGSENKVAELLQRIRVELADTVSIIKSNTLFIDRVENTGVLQLETANDLNAVGPGARASGVRHDVRRTFPYAAYGELEFHVPEHNNGDVNCRMNMKIEECFESINLMLNAISAMPSGKIHEPLPELKPYSFAFGMTEAPRGENIHWIMTGENNTVYRYKIRTPSFCNWPAVCHAVKGNIIQDFPLINKSFNLSYAGNDL